MAAPLETNIYEVSFLVKDEAAAGKALELIGRHAAAAVPGPLRRITFAYPVKKETAGFFGVVRAEAVPASAKQLERDLEASQEVLRALVLRANAERAPIAGVPAEAAKTKPRLAPRPRPDARPSAPLSNEALERKIEEILQ